MSQPEKTKLSSKGQVIIPKKIRADRGWHRGTRLWIQETKDGVLLSSPQEFEETSLEDVAGCLPYRGKPKTLRDMELAIKRGAHKQCPPPR